MMRLKKLALFLLLIIASLVLGEIPYLNILVAGKLWVLYLPLLFFLIVPLSTSHLLISVVFFLLGAFLLTLLKIAFFAEILGTAIYFLLWLIILLEIKSHLQES